CTTGSDAEFVNTVPHDLEGAIDGLRLVRHHTLRLIHFERHVNAALQIEPPLERHSRERRVVEYALGIPLTHGGGAGEERPDRHGNQGEDSQETIAEITHATSTR